MKKKSTLGSEASEARELVSQGPGSARRSTSQRGHARSQGGVRDWLRQHGFQTLFIDPNVPLESLERDY